MRLTVFVSVTLFVRLCLYLSGNLRYLDMSIKGQSGTSDGTVQPNGSVCVCARMNGKYRHSRH